MQGKEMTEALAADCLQYYSALHRDSSPSHLPGSAVRPRPMPEATTNLPDRTAEVLRDLDRPVIPTTPLSGTNAFPPGRLSGTVTKGIHPPCTMIPLVKKSSGASFLPSHACT